ncbi:hypothetical protein [Bradyrhizobium neotropicale]|uniref:hypothetical protein n=1 Tax=Bradyrhizobium neotropicale TaxID=1497615 RepID=UPI0039081BA6
MLYAQDRWSLLLVFQAMDAAGKDSTIKHVMSGVNPQGCQVYSFKQPSQAFTRRSLCSGLARAKTSTVRTRSCNVAVSMPSISAPVIAVFPSPRPSILAMAAAVIL